MTKRQSSRGQRALAVVEALLCEQTRGGKRFLRMIRPGRLGAQLLRELLHLHQVALDAWKALGILGAQPGGFGGLWSKEGVLPSNGQTTLSNKSNVR